MSRRCSLKRGQHTLYLLATRLEKAWQLQIPTKGLDRLVDRKSWNIGRDLEQYPAGLAEVDRAEILAVLLFGRMSSVFTDQLFGHLRLLHVVRGAEGDVMYRTASLVPTRNSRGFVDVDHGAFHVACCSEANHRSFTGNLAEAEHIGQDRCRLPRAVEKQRHALQATDRMFGGDVLVAPSRLILGIGDTYERERHPVLIRER